MLDNLVKDTIKSLVLDNCYLHEHREELRNYKFIITECLYHDARKLFQKLDEDGNTEKFYSSYFSIITSNPLKYFPSLSHQMATLLSIRLADHLLEHYKQPQQSVQNQPRFLSKPEINGLQYLAGYVIHKMLKKFKINNTTRNQKFVAFLERMLVKDEKEKDSQHLIATQDRGGLKAVCEEIISIFSESEKIFRLETDAETHFSKIDIPYMLAVIMKNSTVVSVFQELTGQDENYNELEDLFHSMIELYLRVRAFSLAKDITQKYKMKIKLDKAKGSLRKNIKHPEK